MSSGLLLLAAALVTWPAPTEGVARRLRSLQGLRARAPAAGPRLPVRTRRWCTAAALGLAVALLLGGPVGVAAAPVVGALAARR